MSLIGVAAFASGCVTGKGEHTDTISGVEYTEDPILGTCKNWKVYLDHDNGLPSKMGKSAEWDGIYSIDPDNKDLIKFLKEASVNKRPVTISTEEKSFHRPCKYHGSTVIISATYADNK